MKEKKSISRRVLLVTSPRENGEEWLVNKNYGSSGLRKFSRLLSLRDIHLTITTADQLLFKINNGDSSIVDLISNSDIKDFDLIHVRGVNRSVQFYTDIVPAIETYIAKNKFIEVADSGFAYGKISQLFKMAQQGLPVPDTFATWHPKKLLSLDLTTAGFGYPLILKASFATEGNDNYLIHDADDLRTTIDTFSNDKVLYLLQKAIDNNGDYRVLFIGDLENPIIFKRNRIEGTHVSNTSKGADSYLVDDLPAEAMKIARGAHRIMGRSISGVDVIQDIISKRWYVLEVNSHPALATGDHTDKKVAAYEQMVRSMK